MSGQLSIPNLPKDKELAGKMLDNANSLDRFKAERGAMGSIWGTSSNVAHNIAAFLIIICLAVGVLYTYLKANAPIDEKSLSIKDFWAIITPLISLSIGYLFGEKKGAADKS